MNSAIATIRSGAPGLAISARLIRTAWAWCATICCANSTSAPLGAATVVVGRASAGEPSR
jgi:hypothetical protein